MPGRPHHSASWHRCVESVGSSGKVDSPEAVCTASVGKCDLPRGAVLWDASRRVPVPRPAVKTFTGKAIKGGAGSGRLPEGGTSSQPASTPRQQGAGAPSVAPKPTTSATTPHVISPGGAKPAGGRAGGGHVGGGRHAAPGARAGHTAAPKAPHAPGARAGHHAGRGAAKPAATPKAPRATGGHPFGAARHR